MKKSINTIKKIAGLLFTAFLILMLNVIVEAKVEYGIPEISLNKNTSDVVYVDASNEGTSLEFIVKYDDKYSIKSDNSEIFKLENDYYEIVSVTWSNITLQERIYYVNVKGMDGYLDHNTFSIKAQIEYCVYGSEHTSKTMLEVFKFVNSNTQSSESAIGHDLTITNNGITEFAFGSTGVTLKNLGPIEIKGFNDSIIFNKIECYAANSNFREMTNFKVSIDQATIYAETGKEIMTLPYNLKCYDGNDTLKLVFKVYYYRNGGAFYQIYYFDGKTDLIKTTVNYGTFDSDADASGIYGDPDTLVDILDPYTGIGSIIYSFAKIVAAILTFVCVMLVGYNIIQARGKAEERSSAMQGLMYITIGVIILDLALFIYGLLSSLAGDPSEDLENYIAKLVSDIQLL